VYCIFEGKLDMLLNTESIVLSPMHRTRAEKILVEWGGITPDYRLSFGFKLQ
jgi:hypothetical protein